MDGDESLGVPVDSADLPDAVQKPIPDQRPGGDSGRSGRGRRGAEGLGSAGNRNEGHGPDRRGAESAE